VTRFFSSFNGGLGSGLAISVIVAVVTRVGSSFCQPKSQAYFGLDSHRGERSFFGCSWAVFSDVGATLTVGTDMCVVAGSRCVWALSVIPSTASITGPAS
jgi:hypothetical protein